MLLQGTKAGKEKGGRGGSVWQKGTKPGENGDIMIAISFCAVSPRSGFVCLRVGSAGSRHWKMGKSPTRIVAQGKARLIMSPPLVGCFMSGEEPWIGGIENLN